MKRININVSIAATIIAAFFMGCKETPPEIDYSSPIAGDTTYTEAPESPQPKVVMLEEFTGVKCTNCPEANDLSKSMLDANPARLAVSGLHSGGLAIPYNDTKHTSKYDFRVPEAAAIADFFSMQGQPQAMVDRVKFDNEPEIVLFKGSWSTRTNERLSEIPPVNLYIETLFDNSSNTLFITVTAKFTKDITDPLNISVGLTETDIIDLQGSKDKTNYPPDGVIKEYTHRHALRVMPTGWHGRPLNVPDQKAGRVVVRNFIIDFTDKEWKLDKCSVYAFVHYTGISEEILQAAEVHVK